MNAASHGDPDRQDHAHRCAREGGEKTYIRAKGYPSVPFDGYQEKLKAASAWRSYEMPCGHDAMVDMPDRLTEILIEVA